MKKSLYLSAALCALFSAEAFAADAIVAVEPAPLVTSKGHNPWFVDVGVGAGFSHASGLDFFNPIGTDFTDNDTSGDRILLKGLDKSDSSFIANVGVGYMFNQNIYAKASYRYFGRHKYSGWAGFNGDEYDQDMKVTAHGVYVGIGYIHDLTDRLYLDMSGEIGASFLRASANQGKNLDSSDYGKFPSHTQTNFSGGLALGLGYRLTERVDFTLTGSYHWLGSAKTDKTVDVDGMNDGEYLKAKKIGVAGISAGIRMKF